MHSNIQSKKQRWYTTYRATAIAIAALILSLQRAAVADIRSDANLPNNSTVSEVGNRIKIGGGTYSGTSLFHSFDEFSVDDGMTVIFSGFPNAENIFSRVTGNSRSTIDGTIRRAGNANLFLLNPNGITFGNNARLNIGGSFLASTADYISFDNDLTFSSTNSEFQPILTVSTPIGLRFSARSEDIINRSARGLQVPATEVLALIGGDIAVESSALFAENGRIEIGSVSSQTFLPFRSELSKMQLEYPDNVNFQDINIRNALIDVGGEGNGVIRIQGENIFLTEDSFLSAETSGESSQSSISLTATDSIELRGGGTGVATETVGIGNAGDVEIRTGRLGIYDGAFIGTQSRRNTIAQPGNINIRASESVEVVGTTPDRIFPSSIVSSIENNASGRGVILEIETSRLSVQAGGQIFTENFGSQSGVGTNINAVSIKLNGDILEADGFPSGISSSSDVGATGSAGDISITTQQLTVENGAQISSITLGEGDAGKLSINSREFVSLLGTSVDGSASGLFAQVEGDASGSGGELTVNTNQLEILGGAQISSSARGEGSGGRIILEVDDFILVSGTSALEDGQSSSNILVSAEPGAVGDGGDLTIITDALTVENGGKISADNFGSGRGSTANINVRQLLIRNGGRVGAGSLTAPGVVASLLGAGGELTVTASETIEVSGSRVIGSESVNSQLFTRAQGAGSAGNLFINEAVNGDLRIIIADEGEISASSVSSTGGNIIFNNPNLLLLRTGGRLTAEAGEAQNSGDGGNITLNMPDGFIVAPFDENSDIVANAFSGNGGNINIISQNIIGLEQRPATANNGTNDIDASSQFGNSGTVTLNNLEVDPTQGLVELPANTTAPNQVAQRCLADGDRTNAFIISGQGGTSPNPRNIIRNETAGLLDFGNNIASTPIPDNSTQPTLVSDTGFEEILTEEAPIVEAQGWQRSQNGTITLTAQSPTPPNHSTVADPACSRQARR